MGRAVEIRISNTPDFGNAAWQLWEPLIPWTLPSEPGEHWVYIQFRDAAGRVAGSADSIPLSSRSGDAHHACGDLRGPSTPTAAPVPTPALPLLPPRHRADRSTNPCVRPQPGADGPPVASGPFRFPQPPSPYHSVCDCADVFPHLDASSAPHGRGGARARPRWGFSLPFEGLAGSFWASPRLWRRSA